MGTGLDLKTALLDASSAILLFRAGLHKTLPARYHIQIPLSAFLEITDNSKPGAAAYETLVAESEVHVIGPRGVPALEHHNSIPLQPGSGEYDCVRLYQTGCGDFLIIDDGKAAKYCMRQGIPFINALLVPIILGFVPQDPQERAAMSACCEKIAALGRYSEKILRFAANCSRDELAFFLPF